MAPKRVGGPLPGVLSVYDAYSYGGGISRWLERAWLSSVAHGSELRSSALPGRNVDATDDDRCFEELERAGWIRRSSPKPCPTREQAFFGMVQGGTRADQIIASPARWKHGKPSWWMWEPARECADFAHWVATRLGQTEDMASPGDGAEGYAP